ncbi:hypothetical protein Pfo_010639 [Paulownia fortunei]|nr:hypothetical protein Pfo_010639 [Paulownia fortunei]
MRTSATSFHFSPVSKMTTPESAAAKETFSPPATIQRSPWHSPVPYLFGGLAAMLGLIAFALLILACSYWKLSGQVNGGEDGGERDVEGGPAEKVESSSDAKALPAFEEKFLVIMAGDVKPTFLATPTSSRAGSFNDEINNNSKDKEKEENEKPKHQNQTEVRTQENGEASQESQLSQEQIQA